MLVSLTSGFGFLDAVELLVRSAAAELDDFEVDAFPAALLANVEAFLLPADVDAPIDALLLPFAMLVFDVFEVEAAAAVPLAPLAEVDALGGIAQHHH